MAEADYERLLKGFTPPEALRKRLPNAPVPKLTERQIERQNENMDKTDHQAVYEKNDRKPHRLNPEPPEATELTLPTHNAQAFKDQIALRDEARDEDIMHADRGNYKRSALAIDRQEGMNVAYLAVNEANATVKLSPSDKENVLHVDILDAKGKPSASYDLKINPAHVDLSIEGNAKGMTLDLTAMDGTKLGHSLAIKMYSPFTVEVGKDSKNVEVLSSHMLPLSTEKGKATTKLVYSGIAPAEVIGNINNIDKNWIEGNVIKFDNKVEVSLPRESSKASERFTSEVTYKYGKRAETVNADLDKDDLGNALDKARVSVLKQVIADTEREIKNQGSKGK